eukprot:3132587-Amphidinium_carterae.2
MQHVRSKPDLIGSPCSCASSPSVDRGLASMPKKLAKAKGKKKAGTGKEVDPVDADEWLGPL